MRRICIWHLLVAALIWLALPTVAVAQATGDTLAPGTRVRITIEDVTRPADAALHNHRIRGALVSTSPDSLVLRPSPATGALAVPWSGRPPRGG